MTSCRLGDQTDLAGFLRVKGQACAGPRGWGFSLVFYGAVYGFILGANWSIDAKWLFLR